MRSKLGVPTCYLQVTAHVYSRPKRSSGHSTVSRSFSKHQTRILQSIRDHGSAW